MRVIEVDGSAESAQVLLRAVADALHGGQPVLPTHPAARHVAEAMHPAEPAEAGTAMLVATSGSTGQPKGVLLSAAALTASATATHRRLGGGGRWLLATPAHYIGGLQVLVRSIVAGTDPVVLDLSTGFRAVKFAAAAAQVLAESGPHYTAIVPTQLTRLLDTGGTGGTAMAALRAFDAVLIGGAATPPQLRERAADAGIPVISTYGMSETAGGCVYDGVPLDGVRTRLDAAGRIQITGPVLATGYRRDPLATAAAFTDGWFHTNDLGEFAPDGTLSVLGRADDVINTGGVKVPAGAVERALLRHDGVRQACVVGIAHSEWGELVAAAVVPGDAVDPPAEAELAALVRTGVGAAAVPKLVRFFDSLPLLGPGKVDRNAVRGSLSS